AGMCALYMVVPLAGGALVFATYWIGRRLGRPWVGLGAAWLVATSPTLLYMVVQPMSDVPAAAAWAIAAARVLGGTAASPALGGIAAGAAIVVRPNLAPLAIPLAFWIVRRRRTSALWFLTPTAVGAAIVAVINTRVHGSPLASGYDLTGGFALSHVV